MPTPALAYSSTPKMAISLSAPLVSKEDLSLAYTPGIAEVCKLIQTDPSAMFTHTFRRNNLAVISDGSAVLGLGNIGHKAAYPVMEGKAMLFRRFGNIDAIPLVVAASNDEELIQTIIGIADSFAAINLEDIAAPRCFRIERELKERLSIPLMHDDQQGTAVVVLAAVRGALTLLPHLSTKTRIVISGAGAAGVAIARLLLAGGFSNLVIVDSQGIVSSTRTDLKDEKQYLADHSNPEGLSGSLQDALTGAGIFIGVSKAGLLTADDIARMHKDSVVIAMANPIPEIMPDEAKKGGAAVVATGRSDFPNQVNNALGFPGIFRAAIDARAPITQTMLLAASQAITQYHAQKLSLDNLMPSILDEGVHTAIAKAVAQAI